MNIKWRKFIKQDWLCFSILLLTFYTAASCTIPIDQVVFLHSKDKIAPEITILTPADVSPFSSITIVTGKVTNASHKMGITSVIG